MKVYETAKALLGQHLTLDPSVPRELGCAQAVSAVLKKTGVVGIPKKGFSGTRELYDFMEESPQFKEVEIPLPGDIAIDVSGTSTKGVVHGHTGVQGKTHVMNNNSTNGKWEATYTLQGWKENFEDRGGFVTRYFRVL